MSRSFKRVLTVLLAALVMVMFSIPTAFAAETGNATGTGETDAYAAMSSSMIKIKDATDVKAPMPNVVEGTFKGSMAKMGAVKLIEQNGKYTVKFQLSSEKITNVILGEKNKADAVTDEGKADADGYFTLPVSELDKAFKIAYHSSHGWFNQEMYVSEDLINENNVKVNTDEIVQYIQTEQVNGTADSKILADEKAFVDAFNCPMLVAGLIGEIYIHPKTTAEDQAKQTKWVAVAAKLAKYAYDKLPEAEKAEVPGVPDNAGYTGADGNAVDGYEYPDAGGAEYFESTGDPSKDDPLNTAPDKKKEILVCSFGTSFTYSRVATIGGVEKALAKAYPNYSVRRAFTSQVIINHILARDGEKINTVREAFALAKKAGVTEIIVQPTTLMQGEEYDLLKANVRANQGDIKVKYTLPLLGEVGKDETVVNADKEAVAKALVADTVKEGKFASREAAETDKTAFVYVGHGTGHKAAVSYSQMQTQFNKLGYNNCFVGTVEGNPASTSLPEVYKAVKAAGYTKVVLRAMMVVAGDHANNDIAGDEEGAWYYSFANGGEYEGEGTDGVVDLGTGFGKENVSNQIKGLGEVPAIQQMYVAHAKDAGAVAAKAPAKTKITKAKAGKKSVKLTWKKVTKNSTGYQVRYSTKKSMKSAKIVKVKSAKTTSVTVKKLKKGKKYDLQVRTVNTKTGLNSAWSATKAVKAK